MTAQRQYHQKICQTLTVITELPWEVCKNNSSQIVSPIIDRGFVLDKKALTKAIHQHPLGDQTQKHRIMFGDFSIKKNNKLIDFIGGLFLHTVFAAQEEVFRIHQSQWQPIKMLIEQAPYSPDVKKHMWNIKNKHTSNNDELKKTYVLCNDAIWETAQQHGFPTRSDSIPDPYALSSLTA